MDCVSRWWQFLVSRLVGILSCVLLVLLALFFAVMFSESTEKCIADLLGLKEKGEKFEILKFLGIGMGGILLALQAVNSHRRAKAMEDAANAQAGATAEQAKANQNTEDGQRQERLKNAIEHLGHNSDSVRLGGAYELFHLAKDTEELRQTVLDILCAHIRQSTAESGYREKYKSKPSEEVQSLLTLLFVQEHEVFKGLRANLQGSWLNGANLNRARLQSANFSGAHLQGAELQEAKLQGANLRGAYLQETKLYSAHLHGVDLMEAKLQVSDLRKARLYGANLVKTELQMADLFDSHLQGTTFEHARLQGATLVSARLQGANLVDASLQGARLNHARLQGIHFNDSTMSFIERMRDRVDQENESNIAIFEGGLMQEDVDSLAEGMPNENAKMSLRKKLEPHIGKREKKQLPEDSSAVTGAYTKEEAEQWIAEYKQAMSKAPGAGDS